MSTLLSKKVLQSYLLLLHSALHKWPCNGPKNILQCSYSNWLAQGPTSVLPLYLYHSLHTDYTSALKMHAAQSSETLAVMCQIIRCHGMIFQERMMFIATTERTGDLLI
jgi:hypothetical protein